MANASLKTDFRDGDLLFAQHLNNNFKAIQAALETMNKIVWQDNHDTVISFRGTTEEIDVREIIDGQLLYNTTTGETFIDYEGKRINTGLGNIPAGSIIEFQGDIVPLGWELISENEDGSKTIKKVLNTPTVPGEIKTEKTTSDKDTYSCNYVNTSLKNLMKEITNTQGEIIAQNWGTEVPMEGGNVLPFVHGVTKENYDKFDLICYLCNDFENEEGLHDDVDTQWVVASAYKSDTARVQYVDYKDNTIRFWQRNVSITSDRCYAYPAYRNGQTYRHILVPVLLIGYKTGVLDRYATS